MILVSHDLDAVNEMADEVIWLDKGTIKMIGSSSEVISAYKASGN
jgi:ABC-type polysaccharide/polyol phosphate transport system ATPase subunit